MAKSTNSRPALSSVSTSTYNTLKPTAGSLVSGSKVSAGPKAQAGDKAPAAAASTKYTTAHIMASLAARKARVPLSTVDASKVHVFRDPTPYIVRARHTAAPPVTATSTVAVGVPAVKGTDARALKALRISASASNIAAAGKPAPVAGQKRRADVNEPERVVRTKLSKDTTASATARAEHSAEATAKPSTVSEPESVDSCADSQATVVEYAEAEVKERRIANPSRAFSALRTLAGQAAQAPATAAAPKPPVAKAEPVCDWDDIDAEDSDDPLMVSEYIGDIIEYLREREQTTMPNPAYMGKQKELTWEMRRVLVNWIVQIHYQLRMLPETLFLAVNIVDRFLSKRQVAVGKFQLVGLTALMLACKYEETTTPHIEDFVYLAGNSYSVKEILNTEVFMLSVLDFDMSYPNPMTFLRRVSKAEEYNMQTRTVAKYLMEICLVDHRLMQYSPSHIAAASIFLGRRILESGPWNANLRHYSGYTEAELGPCVATMLDHLLLPPDNEFVFWKYQHRRYLAVSKYCFDWAGCHQNEIKPMTPPTGFFSTSIATTAAAAVAAAEASDKLVAAPRAVACTSTGNM
ncbi:G2/mitotic-specific cyclin [Coemansia sp. RSA 2322]|nr:G2/mitotic-specific cyclin [Coemansia sp. RSA 2322]